MESPERLRKQNIGCSTGFFVKTKKKIFSGVPRSFSEAGEEEVMPFRPAVSARTLKCGVVVASVSVCASCERAKKFRWTFFRRRNSCCAEMKNREDNHNLMCGSWNVGGVLTYGAQSQETYQVGTWFVVTLTHLRYFLP